MLMDLVPENSIPTDLFAQIDMPDTARSKILMATLDEINAKMGRGTVRSAGEGMGHAFGQQESGLHDRLEAAPYSPLVKIVWQQLTARSGLRQMGVCSSA